MDELDNLDIIVEFWAIDNTLQRIRATLDEIAKICDNTEGYERYVD